MMVFFNTYPYFQADQWPARSETGAFFPPLQWGGFGGFGASGFDGVVVPAKVAATAALVRKQRDAGRVHLPFTRETSVPVSSLFQLSRVE